MLESLDGEGRSILGEPRLVALEDLVGMEALEAISPNQEREISEFLDKVVIYPPFSIRDPVTYRKMEVSESPGRTGIQ